MRQAVWAAGLIGLAACSSASPQQASLTLVNHFWDRVNVEAVITTNADCGARNNGYVKTQDFAMGKGQTYKITAPHGEAICWRHDPNPNNPVKGVWSGWSRAILFPGQSAETDL